MLGFLSILQTLLVDIQSSSFFLLFRSLFWWSFPDNMFLISIWRVSLEGLRISHVLQALEIPVLSFRHVFLASFMEFLVI